MSFANPLALWLLSAIPAVLLFHFYRVQRRAVRVTTLRFWEPVARDQGATRAAWRRFKPNWLLLFQLLAVLALVLALARPTLTLDVVGWPRLVLIIDTSASMKATDVPGGRFTAAREQAQAVLAALQPGQQVMLMSSRPEVLVPFGENAQPLREQLEALRPGDSEGKLEEAIQIAWELVPEGEHFTSPLDHSVTEGNLCVKGRFGWTYVQP